MASTTHGPQLAGNQTYRVFIRLIDTADCDRPDSGSQETIHYRGPEDETEEPVLKKEEIEHLQSGDSESTRQYDSEFVQFDETILSF